MDMRPEPYDLVDFITLARDSHLAIWLAAAPDDAEAPTVLLIERYGSEADFDRLAQPSASAVLPWETPEQVARRVAHLHGDA